MQDEISSFKPPPHLALPSAVWGAEGAQTVPANAATPARLAMLGRLGAAAGCWVLRRADGQGHGSPGESRAAWPVLRCVTLSWDQGQTQPFALLPACSWGTFLLQHRLFLPAFTSSTLEHPCLQGGPWVDLLIFFPRRVSFSATNQQPGKRMAARGSKSCVDAGSSPPGSIAPGWGHGVAWALFPCHAAPLASRGDGSRASVVLSQPHHPAPRAWPSPARSGSVRPLCCRSGAALSHFAEDNNDVAAFPEIFPEPVFSCSTQYCCIIWSVSSSFFGCET